MSRRTDAPTPRLEDDGAPQSAERYMAGVAQLAEDLAATPPRPRVLTLASVRRDIKRLFGDAATVPADGGRIIHREVDK